MEKDKESDFNAKLARALDDSIVLTEKAQSVQVEKLASQRLQELVRATAHLERSKANTRFGWSLFFVAGVMMVVAVYMRADGRTIEGLVTLMLSLIPLLAGAALLHRVNVAQRKRADALEQLNAPSK